MKKKHGGGKTDAEDPLAKLRTRFEVEKDTKGKAALKQAQLRAQAVWPLIPESDQKLLAKEFGIPHELALASLNKDSAAITAGLQAKMTPENTEPVHLVWLEIYKEIGNPICALGALWTWPNEPLAHELQFYLRESIAPLLEAALDMASGDPKAPSPAQATKNVAEWFALSGRRGGTNAFADYARMFKEAEVARKAEQSSAALIKQVVGEVAQKTNSTDASVRYRLRKAAKRGK